MNKKPKRYALEKELTSGNLNKFMDQVRKKKAKQFIISDMYESFLQEGKNYWNFVPVDFEQKVKSLQADVLVLFRNEFCDKCEIYVEKINSIVEELREEKPDFKFAFGMMNVTKNDAPIDVLKQYVFYFYAKDKPEKPILVPIPQNPDFIKGYILKNTPSYYELNEEL